MQEAIPYRTYIHAAAGSPRPPSQSRGGTDASPVGSNDASNVQKIIQENAVVVFGKRGCCMCHVMKTLLLGHGANPAVSEVDEAEEETIVGELLKTSSRGKGGETVSLPAVFVGGRLFGGLDQVMAAHISGELVPVLKEAGALWL